MSTASRTSTSSCPSSRCGCASGTRRLAEAPSRRSSRASWVRTLWTCPPSRRRKPSRRASACAPSRSPSRTAGSITRTVRIRTTRDWTRPTVTSTSRSRTVNRGGTSVRPGPTVPCLPDNRINSTTAPSSPAFWATMPRSTWAPSSRSRPSLARRTRAVARPGRSFCRAGSSRTTRARASTPTAGGAGTFPTGAAEPRI